MQKPEISANSCDTTCANSVLDEAFEYKEKFYLLKEKFNVLKKYAKAETRDKSQLAEQIKAIKEENSRLKKELRVQQQRKDHFQNDKLETNPSFLPNFTKRNESVWIENESSICEMESLKIKLLKAENEIEAFRSENRKYQKDVEVVVSQLRTMSSENLLMKTRMESAVAERTLTDKKANAINDELVDARQRIKDLQSENEVLSRKSENFLQKIDELSLKVISPHEIYYAYQIKKISYIGVENMLMILRFKLNKDIVLQFESAENDAFEIKFRDIKSIEKSVKTLNQIRITVKTLFNQTFDFEVQNRQRVLEDIKKFWRLFLADPERPQQQGFDVYEKIKGIFFDV